VLAGLVTLALLALTLLLSALGTASPVHGEAPSPPPDTIVEITGDAANGFGIGHYDGSWLFPPTGSEALAECGEYDRRLARVRCRTKVRTWYRDLAATQQALKWAHASRTPG
jgi:hypothetical protein